MFLIRAKPVDSTSAVLLRELDGLAFAPVELTLDGTAVQVQNTKNTGYRTFLDARGQPWEVWMVHPSSIERRKMERRSPVENAVYLIEERVLGDRRAHAGTRGAVATEFSSGWLCFSGNGERRRLAPVPVNWMSANEIQVAEWCRVAKRVVRCGPVWDPEDEKVLPRQRSAPRNPDAGRPGPR